MEIKAKRNKLKKGEREKEEKCLFRLYCAAHQYRYFISFV